MGLPMYVSPSISKRQLPSKQPTSPPYTPQAEESFEEAFQNSRILNSFETQPELPQRSQRSRRSSSLPYNFVQQQIHRLHQLQLHRTREQQQQMTSNLASRRGLNSAHYLSLNHHTRIQHMQQMQAAAQARRQDRNLASESSFETTRNNREERLDDSQDEIMDFPLDDLITSLDNNNNNNNSRSNGGISVDGSGNVQGNSSNSNNNNNNNNNNQSQSQSHNDNDNSNHSHHHHRSSSIALDNVIRRVNLLRQISQQQEIRSMRPSSRHHRSSIGHSSSGRSSRITSQNINVDRRRDDLIQRGIDILPSSSTVRPDSTLFYEHNSPLPPIQRLSAWHTRRGVNWPTVDPPSVQRTDRRSSFADDFYSTSEISHQYESDDHNLSRILSPIPRRYDARFTTTLASLPIGNDHELLESDDNNRSNVETEQRGSASGEVC